MKAVLSQSTATPRSAGLPRTGYAGVQGFTLIEMLIVLAIIGITLTMIRLGGGVLESVSGNAPGQGETQAALQRLVRSASVASEQAMIRGRPIVLDLSTGRYRFLALDVSGNWIPVDGDPVLAERALPSDWRWKGVWRDGEVVDSPYRVLFGNEPVKFSIQIATHDRQFLVRGNSLGAVDWVLQ